MRHCCPKCHYKKLVNTWIGPHYGWCCAKCGLIISHNKRDAEIQDYFTVLDKMAMTPEEEFLAWWRSVRKSASRTGLGVLHQTEFLTVFKNQEAKNTSIEVFFNAHRNGDKLVHRRIDDDIWRHAALARPILFRKQHVKLVVNPITYRLFPNDSLFPEGSRISKAVKEAAVEWAIAFEAAYPALKARAAENIKTWEQNEAVDSRATGTCRHVDRGYYNGFFRTYRIAINGALTPQAILEIERIVQEDKARQEAARAEKQAAAG